MPDICQDFADWVGFRQLGLAAEVASLLEILSPLPAAEWCLVGGGAIAAWLGGDLRPVSPDIDILARPAAIACLRTKLPLHPSRIGWQGTLSSGAARMPLAIDILPATAAFDYAGLGMAVPLDCADCSLSLAPLCWLLLGKLRLGRARDLCDARLMLGHDPAVTEPTLAACRKWFPDELEDIASSLHLLALEIE